MCAPVAPQTHAASSNLTSLVQTVSRRTMNISSLWWCDQCCRACVRVSWQAAESEAPAGAAGAAASAWASTSLISQAAATTCVCTSQLKRCSKWNKVRKNSFLCSAVWQRGTDGPDAFKWVFTCRARNVPLQFWFSRKRKQRATDIEDYDL